MAHAERQIHVEVAYSPAAREVEVVALTLTDGASVADAVRQSGMHRRHGLRLGTLVMSLWGKRCESSTGLREGDRVELCRPLVVDPMQARRLRDKAQADTAKGQKKRPAVAGRRSSR